MEEKSGDGVEIVPTTVTDEGDGQITTRTPPMELRDDSASDQEDSEDHSEEDDDAMTKFLDGDRPTSAGEPSHNVPRKLEINPWCISTSILLITISVFILITIFAPKLFETAIQNMLHFIIDTNTHNDGHGGFQITNFFMIFFCIFNTSVFAMCANIDYLLMVSCGYLYGDDRHEWLTGAAVYIICNYIGCCVTFAIGRALLKDKLYFLFSKYEKYRYFQRAFTDYAPLLATTLNLNPFLPSGIIVYILSTSSMSWPFFLMGQASRIPNAAIMCYAGYVIRRYTENEPIENTNIDRITIFGAYKSNPYTFSLTVTFCILFAMLLLVTTFAIYLQFQRLVLGDALKKAEQGNESSTTSSSSSLTSSNEDMDDSNEETSSSSSSISGNTLDEYGDSLDEQPHKQESFLFQDDYDPAVADQSDSEHSNAAEIEMNEMKKSKKKRRRKHKSKHRLDTNGERKKKKHKKKKKKKINNKIWQTIVLATSPTENNSMLFEEGPKKDTEQNYFGRQQQTGSIVIDVKTNGNDKTNANNRKTSKSNKTSSPRSPRAAFGKLFSKSDGNQNDASSPRAKRRD